jgi:hypothetical protein
LNVPEAVNCLREAFSPRKPTGAAFLRRPTELDPLLATKGAVGIVALLRQTIQQELGKVSERKNQLCVYTVAGSGDPVLLDGTASAAVVRSCMGAVRLRDPSHQELRARMIDLEAQLAMELRRPTSEDIDSGLRHVVWPIAVMILV